MGATHLTVLSIESRLLLVVLGAQRSSLILGLTTRPRQTSRPARERGTARAWSRASCAMLVISITPAISRFLSCSSRSILRYTWELGWMAQREDWSTTAALARTNLVEHDAL